MLFRTTISFQAIAILLIALNPPVLTQVFGGFFPTFNRPYVSDGFVGQGYGGEWNSDLSHGLSFSPMSSFSYKGSRSFTSCDQFFQHKIDNFGEYGVISIPDPDLPQSDTRIIFTVAKQLYSVSEKKNTKYHKRKKERGITRKENLCFKLTHSYADDVQSKAFVIVKRCVNSVK